jgi:hypothetical protein
MGDTPQAPLQPAWMAAFTPRELAQIRHARVYAADHLDAGAPGHGQFLLIAELARLLDEREPHADG